jgi:hypothetical protein
MEASRTRTKGGFACPACKALFIIEEHYDPFVSLRDRLYGRYSRASPYIILVLVFGGSVAGAACYGLGAAAVFAGPEAAARWVGFRTAPASSIVGNMWVLSWVGPGLVFLRLLPSFGSAVLLPFSAFVSSPSCCSPPRDGIVYTDSLTPQYGAHLIADDNLPSWPPSPGWALAMMPYVQFTYTYLLYELFGPLERRLNRALRGRPANEEEEEEAAPNQEAAQAIAAPEAAAAGAQAARDQEELGGIWGPVLQLSRAILGLFADLPAEGGVEVDVAEHFELRIDAIGENDDQGRGGQVPGEEDLAQGEDEFQLLAEDAAEQQQEQQQPQPPAADAPPAQQARAEQLAPQPAGPNHQPPAQNQNNRRRNNNNNNVPGQATSYFTLITNSLASSFLLPAIACGMGELIRATAPKSWVTRSCRSRAPTGLLQEHWGRSLAGGCLFVVLRDAFALYTKYRRVQARAKRRVRNVERRADRSSQ